MYHKRWVLSASLFLAKLNSITEAIPPHIQYSLYADDLQISVSSCNLAIYERRFQVAIANLTKWADDNGFKLYPEKAACVCFTRKWGIQNAPALTMYNKRIRLATENKYFTLS